VDQGLNVFFNEPQLFLPVLGLSVLLLGAGGFLAYRIAIVFIRRIHSLRWLAGTVSGFERCRIANWKQIRALVFPESEPGLNAAFDRIDADSEDLFHGTWIPQPSTYLKPWETIPAKESWLLSKEAVLLPAVFGVVASVVCVLLGFVFRSQLVLDGRVGAMVLDCSLSALLGIFLTVFDAVLLFAMTRWLRKTLDAFGGEIARKVPVYSDSLAVAALLDSFMAYDRQMVAAVGFLDDSVESLASDKLEKAVSHAVEKIMTTAVAPAIENLNTSMVRVTEKLDRNQQEGMNRLAREFAIALAEDFRQHFEPVTTQLDAASDQLMKAEMNFETTLTMVKQLRSETSAMVEEMVKSEKTLEKSRAGFLTEITGIAENLNTLAAASDRMASVYEGNETKLSAAVGNMSTAMDQLGDRVVSLFENAGATSRQTAEQAAAALQANEAHLEEMRKQIMILSDELATRIDQVIIGFGSVTGETLSGFRETLDAQNESFTHNVKELLSQMEEESRSMSLYAKEIDVDLTELKSTFKDSVGLFNQGMVEEIQKTLGLFDTGLAEIVQRLAVSSAEIGDAVEALPQALRGIAPR
jgi:hypothetical protein